MKRSLWASAAVFVALGAAAVPDSPVELEALSVTGYLANAGFAYAASECGDEGGCLSSSEHKIKTAVSPEYAGKHECMEPESHSGGACGPDDLDLLVLRSMTLDQVNEYINTQTNPNATFDADRGVVDLLNCARSAIVARMTVDQLLAA